MLKKNVFFWAFLLAVFAVIPSLTGCASVGADWAPVTSAMIATPGVKIAAEDGSFVLEAGKEFVPPIQTAAWCYVLHGVNLTTANHAKAVAEPGCNARKVRVTVPGKKEPLYGLLVMSKVNPCLSHEIASRSYRIAVPQEYVQQAADGRVSVVYEWGECKRSQGEMIKMGTWALWLSDRPLP